MRSATNVKNEDGKVKEQKKNEIFAEKISLLKGNRPNGALIARCFKKMYTIKKLFVSHVIVVLLRDESN